MRAHWKPIQEQTVFPTDTNHWLTERELARFKSHCEPSQRRVKSLVETSLPPLLDPPKASKPTPRVQTALRCFARCQRAVYAEEALWRQWVAASCSPFAKPNQTVRSRAVRVWRQLT